MILARVKRWSPLLIELRCAARVCLGTSMCFDSRPLLQHCIQPLFDACPRFVRPFIPAPLLLLGTKHRTASMARPNLKDLPEELVSNISLRLWSEDVQALRLTCKALEEKTLHDFASEYFSEKAFIISSASLNVLVAIAKSAKLRGFLRRIHIITAYFSDSAFTCGKKCPYGHCCGWQPTIRQREAWKFLIQDAKNLKTSGKDKEMLTEAFGKLPHLNDIMVRKLGEKQ